LKERAQKALDMSGYGSPLMIIIKEIEFNVKSIDLRPVLLMYKGISIRSVFNS